MGVFRAVAFALVLAGCGAASRPITIVADPAIDFTQNGDRWNAYPVHNNLGAVSNNGLGYTGEIDVYELHIPASGRLQVSLSWEHDADFDLIVAADRMGSIRYVEGLRDDLEPEYVGLDVVLGQSVFLLVAGWEGTPGDYTLETILVPPETPVFALEATTDLEQSVPANAPLRFFFNQDLEPAQVVAEKLAFVTPGATAEGSWCVDHDELTFHPRLPAAPGDPGGLQEGAVYTLQFVGAAHGLRAANGEYLSELYSIKVHVGAPIDDDPLAPPRVTDVELIEGMPWTGAPLTISLAGALHPDFVAMQLVHVQPGGDVSLPIAFTLEQGQTCIGGLQVRLTVQSIDPLPSASTVRLSIPGFVRGITGDPDATNRVGNGDGWQLDLRTP